jgi:epoxyqueuosine reductase
MAAVPADPPPVEELRRVAERAGLDALGVCDATPFVDARAELERRRDAGLHGGMRFTFRNPARSTDPSATLPSVRSLVVGARAYRRDDPPAPAGPHGRVARYARRDHYAALRAGLGEVAAVLRAAGWRAVVLADDNALVDRAAAHRAGIGWYGKSANLLLPGRGSWFVLGSVLTDAVLEPAAEPVPDGCGTCTRCLDGCPTGAIVAPGVVDARRCLAWMVQDTGAFPREHRVALGDRLYGCDDCQEVCPPNRTADRRQPPPGAGDDEAWVDLLDLLAADDASLLDRHGRWYVPRRDARYLRRNALVVLGNVADPVDPRVEAALRAALGDTDPLLRAHAAWAARRLGRPDLLSAVADDPDPEVRAELAAPPPPARVGAAP